MAADHGLFKVVDVTESDDEYSPVVRGHGCQPWNPQAMRRWVEERMWTDDRHLVVRELTGAEYGLVLPPALADVYGVDVDEALRYIQEDEGCECEAGSCDYECDETGNCTGACESECSCPEKITYEVVVAHAARYANYVANRGAPYSVKLRDHVKAAGLS